MEYQEALKRWGAAQLEACYPRSTITVDSVRVELDFDEGYPCCGSSDPHCYCSLAESPKAEIRISDSDSGLSTTISHYSFDFATVLGEIVEAAGGNISA